MIVTESLDPVYCKVLIRAIQVKYESYFQNKKWKLLGNDNIWMRLSGQIHGQKCD